MAERTACLWCPDWPVVALRSRDSGLRDTPVAVLERGDRGPVVISASAEARAEGVTTGLRRREAENRCPGLVVADADSHVEARAFEAVARAVEAFTPRLVLDRPGRLAFPTRGPSRYFGGDESLATGVLAAVGEVGVVDARLGVADGAFAAGLAARAASPGTAHVVAVGESPAFLSEWSVAALGDPELADLLTRLGLRTLGVFAALPAPSVLGRFGPSGARAYRLALGLDEHPPALEEPPPELTETAELDPPATRVETAAFVAKGLADRLLERLETRGLACTRVTIEAETEHGERLARCWRHDGALTPGALAARVRWQLEGWLEGERPEGRRPASPIEDGPVAESSPTMEEATAGLTLLRLAPDEIVPLDGRQLGFWGGDQAAADRAGRVLARVQGMLGHPAVVTPVRQGGRTPGERVRWVPWGDPREPSRPVDAVRAPGANVAETPPWPGALPDPAPARVYEPPLAAELLDGDGQPVTVSARGDPSAPPVQVRCAALPGGGGDVAAWAGPWAHDLRWWDRAARTRCARWQVVVSPGVACLVAVTGGRATVEAIYD
ncbi:MAG TPA: DNA polymerase Y family protein [Acidimicrobiia bacterium]|nr:DNA polymerase Y family protein [Acidimicrobiia bacterium]